MNFVVIAEILESVFQKMQNDEGRVVDLYVPRKCSASNRLIGAKVDMR